MNQSGIQTSSSNLVCSKSNSSEWSKNVLAHRKSQNTSSESNENYTDKQCDLNCAQRVFYIRNWERFKIMKSNGRHGNTYGLVRSVFEFKSLTTGLILQCEFNKFGRQIGLGESQWLLGIKQCCATRTLIKLDNCVATLFGTYLSDEVSDIRSVGLHNVAHQLGVIERLSLGNLGPLTE